MTNSDIIKFFVGFGLVSLFLFAITYILTSLCYQKMFKAYGYEHPGYAWIPFFNFYILATLACDDPFKISSFEIPKKYFIWWWLVAIVVSFIPSVGSFISLIITVICLGYCHDKGIKKLDSSYDNPVLSYISSVFDIVLWFLVLPKKVK